MLQAVEGTFDPLLALGPKHRGKRGKNVAL